MNIDNVKVKSYFLVDKKTGKATCGPLRTRDEARALKVEGESIIQLQAVKFVR